MQRKSWLYVFRAFRHTVRERRGRRRRSGAPASATAIARGDQFELPTAVGDSVPKGAKAMMRVVLFLALGLLLSACQNPMNPFSPWPDEAPVSINTGSSDPLWTYESDPFACKALKGTCG